MPLPQTTTSTHWRTVDVGGARVELFAAGEGSGGDPVVFLPGWGLTARAYAAALLPLCDAGLRVFIPSLPGFGLSSPLGLRAPLAAYASRIVALLDALDPERPVFLAGHSFGGGVALKVAQLRPDLVRSVTVVNPVGGAPDRRGLRRASWLGWSLASAASALPRRRPQLADAAHAARLLRDFVPNVTRRPLRCAASGAVALTAQLAPEARQLADSGLPVLYVWGDRDRLVLPGRLDGLGGPDGTAVVDGGHGWVITHPHEFAATLHEALAVHALLERQGRGIPLPPAAVNLVTDPTTSLSDLFPIERRHRARHEPPAGSARATLVAAQQPPMETR